MREIEELANSVIANAEEMRQIEGQLFAAGMPVPIRDRLRKKEESQ